ncbi:sialin-like [Lucilia sericata]|uniref:sialin-like n=1 Tax=Lucilia sericata TaxID=13632 RepID=UPI0018A862F1|nr:sialin-like [Lucilia sericata]
MDSSLTLDIFKKYLFLPQRVLVSFFGFLAIVNAFIMSHVTEIFLDPIRIPHNNHSTEKAEILMILKRRLNFTSHRKGGLWKQKLWISKHAREDPYIFAFYIGFLITHIPGALIAESYGGKRVLIITLTIMSFITLATPSLVNQYGVKGLLILRIMLGLSEGPLFPAVCCMISRWIPSQERGSLATVVLSGGQIGILIVHLLSVVLYTHIRWTFVFYILGANVLLLCICFIYFVLIITI